MAEKEKKLTQGQKQAQMERKFLAAMEEAKKDTVKITLPLDPNNEEQDVFVSVNGMRYLIKRGEEVEVPRFIAEVLHNSDRQKLAASNRMKELEARGQKKK